MASTPNKIRQRDWCLTVNNYTEDDFEKFFAIDSTYVIVGREKGHLMQTNHLQAYIYYPNPVTFSTVKKVFPKAHIEPRCRNSTPTQAADYCKKDSDYKESGVCPQQGKRNDLDTIRDLIAAGNGMSVVVQQATSYQSVKMAEMILKYHEPSRNWLPEVYWYYGSTGSGKTRAAIELLGIDCYICMSTGKWFEGYDAHPNVLIDDMRKDFMKFHELLRLLDRYPLRIETKGGSRQFLSKKIVITSCYPPDQLYDTREDIQQLIRRIKVIQQFTQPSDTIDYEESYIEHLEHCEYLNDCKFN